MTYDNSAARWGQLYRTKIKRVVPGTLQLPSVGGTIEAVVLKWTLHHAHRRQSLACTVARACMEDDSALRWPT
ncbi:hypothetical protein D6B98_29895 [Bradyrhizobium sp. LVM 105]|nr:hypothetical protein D6B98_29895 [Bradyrhizobium sp. LVM 105]